MRNIQEQNYRHQTCTGVKGFFFVLAKICLCAHSGVWEMPRFSPVLFTRMTCNIHNPWKTGFKQESDSAFGVRKKRGCHGNQSGPESAFNNGDTSSSTREVLEWCCPSDWLKFKPQFHSHSLSVSVASTSWPCSSCVTLFFTPQCFDPTLLIFTF